MTAYLKAHYPVEFMAALLSGDMARPQLQEEGLAVEHLEDCRRMEIEVVPPTSIVRQADFIVADGKICVGLCAIKGCGAGAVAAIVAARRVGAPSAAFSISANGWIPRKLNRATIETLIKAGAHSTRSGAKCAEYGRHRASLAIRRRVARRSPQRPERLVRHAGRRHGPRPRQQRPACPTCAEWDDRHRLAAEKEVLGFYLTSHPLAEHEKTLATFCSHTTANVSDLPHRTEVVLGGMLSAIKFSQTKNPRPGTTNTKYAMFDLEDSARRRALHSLARGVCQSRTSRPGRRRAGHSRCRRSASRQRRVQRDRQRTHSILRIKRPLHQGNPRPRDRAATCRARLGAIARNPARVSRKL